MTRWNGLFIMDATMTTTGISFKLDKTLKPHDLSALISCKTHEVSVVDVPSHHKYLTPCQNFSAIVSKPK
jgi:hypothetical protein